MSGDLRLVRALVGCYPPTWRHRYGEEYAQLLCDMQVHRRPRLVVDSLLGAVRAHGGALMSGDSPLALPVWSAALFTAAGIGFAKLTEDFSRIAATARITMVIASAMALLALATAAAPVAAVLVRGRAGGAWRCLVVPLAAVALWYAVIRIVGHAVPTGPNIAAFAVIAVAGLGVLAATAWAATRISRQVPVAGSDRLRTVAVTAMAVGMAGATISALVWGLRVRTVDAAVFDGGQGLVATPFIPSWIAVLSVLCAATVLSGIAARRLLTDA